MDENTPPIPDNSLNEEVPKEPIVEKTDTKTPVSDEKKKKKKKWITWLIIAAIAISIPVLIYFVKESELSSMKKQHTEEMDSLKTQTTDLIMQTNESNLKNMARVFSWAIRTEALRSNTEEMNRMMVELVKIKEYQQVVLLKEDGSVLLSTDKKYEGEGFSSSFYQQVIGANEVKIHPQKNGDLFVSAPVFGIDVRLGTVLIAYRPTEVTFN